MKHGPRAYRIGWWTHPWWPRSYNLRGLVTGRQGLPRADNGARYVGRLVWLRQIVADLRRLRRPHRPWQAEFDGAPRAYRAFTARGAERRATREAVSS